MKSEGRHRGLSVEGVSLWRVCVEGSCGGFVWRVRVVLVSIQ